MKSKYRIKIHYGHLTGEKYFIVQVRRWWWPWWFDVSSLCETVQEAEQHVAEYKRGMVEKYL